jgi:pimeloyl-ACP methyl ester carboxylesterase
MIIKYAPLLMKLGKRAFMTLLGIFLILVLLLLILAMLNRTRQTLERKVAAPHSGEFVVAADTEIFVQSLGDINAPVVVFIHGTGAWSEIWRASMVMVSMQGYRAIALDLPPFGYSMPPESKDYSKGVQAKRLLAALNSLGIEKAIFVAHSFGAAPVVEALMQEPSRVNRLILVCGALGLDAPQSDGKQTSTQRVLELPWISPLLSTALLSNSIFTPTLMRSFVTEKDKLTPEWIEVYQRPLQLRGSAQAIASWLPELVATRSHWRSDQLDSYAKIAYPVHLIWGQEDSVTPVSQALHLQSLIPDAKLHLIPRSGHVPMVEETMLFEDSLRSALR